MELKAAATCALDEDSTEGIIDRAESDIDVLLDRGAEDVEQHVQELRDGYGQIQKQIDALAGGETDG